MIRFLPLFYGLFVYVIFLAVFLYLIGFIGNQYSFSTIDSGVQIPALEAIRTDLLLLSLFALQHSLMARAWFKRFWTRIVPHPIERSTYVLATCLALALVFRFWEPIPALVWHVSNPVAAPALNLCFAAGWITVIVASAQIGYADLVGLRHAWLFFRGIAYTPPPFGTPGLYKHLRHPMMLGLLAGFWAAPEMSQGHLLFAACMTLYIAIALRFEERDLVHRHGRDYADYRTRVPALLPRFRKTNSS